MWRRCAVTLSINFQRKLNTSPRTVTAWPAGDSSISACPYACAHLPMIQVILHQQCFSQCMQPRAITPPWIYTPQACMSPCCKHQKSVCVGGQGDISQCNDQFLCCRWPWRSGRHGSSKKLRRSSGTWLPLLKHVPHPNVLCTPKRLVVCIKRGQADTRGCACRDARELHFRVSKNRRI